MIIYAVLGYLAVPHTIWADKIIFGSWDKIFIRRFTLGLFLGWALIPIINLYSIGAHKNSILKVRVMLFVQLRDVDFQT